jgi:hypothetical protein
MKRLSDLLLSFVLVFGLVFATGCDSTGSGSTDGQSGTLELRMDGSTNKALSTLSSKSTTADSITSAAVTIGTVSIVPAEDTTEGDSTEVGVQALTDSSFTVDLKRLQAGLDTALTEIEIPSGSYSQVRLITEGKASVTFADSTQRDVMIASGQQTGLKVNFDPVTVESADDRVEVTLNWDVQESLKGNPRGQFVITPVIDATVSAGGSGN